MHQIIGEELVVLAPKPFQHPIRGAGTYGPAKYHSKRPRQQELCQLGNPIGHQPREKRLQQ